MNKFNLPNLGFGLGLRSKHYDFILENKPSIDWFEIISENYMDSKGRPRTVLDKIRSNYPIVMHGVSMSIGSTDPLNKEYLASLKKLASEVEPNWISDHLCWTGINGKNSHDLLPVPLTEEALDHIVPRIQEVQDFLGRRILLENPSSYLTFRADNIPEYEFMAEMAKRADCALLLDVNNIYVASYNHRLDPKKYIDAIPMDRVVQIHLAGHENKGTHVVDTHEGHVIDEVWDLYKYTIKKAQKSNNTPSTMVEWDAGIPEFPVLEAEINMAREFAGQDISIDDKEEYKFNGAGESNHSVRNLQEHLQDAILDGDIAKAQPQTWIVEKPDFPPEEQLAVYLKGYRIRLFEIISNDYEVTFKYLGDKAGKTVRSYIESIPSEFYNVDKYSAGFATWLKDQDVDDFAKNMADLELRVMQVFNMTESEILTQEDLANIDPDKFSELNLRPRTAHIFVEYDNNVNQYMTDFYENEGNAEAAKDDQQHYGIVYRTNDKIYRLTLEKDELELLKELESGKNIGEAMEICATKSDLDEEELSAKIQKWFGRWIANGVLQKLTD